MYEYMISQDVNRTRDRCGDPHVMSRQIFPGSLDSPCERDHRTAAGTLSLPLPSPSPSPPPPSPLPYPATCKCSPAPSLRSTGPCKKFSLGAGGVIVL